MKRVLWSILEFSNSLSDINAEHQAWHHEREDMSSFRC